MQEMIKVTGTPTITLVCGLSNQIKRQETIHNLVVDAGLNFFIRKIFDDFNGSVGPEIITFAAGEGTTAAQAEDTELESEISRTSISLKTIDGNEIDLFGGFIDTQAVGTLTEFGVLTDDDTLIARVVVSDPFEKTQTDFLNISWNFQIG